MTTFLQPASPRSPTSRACRSWSTRRSGRVIEAGLKMPAGQGRRQLHLAQGRRGGVPAAGDARAPLRRRGHRHGVRRAGAGRHGRAQGRDLRARVPHPDRAGRLPAARTSSSTRTSSPSRTGIEEHDGYARRLHRGDARDQARRCRTRRSPAACATCRFSFRGNERVREAIHAVFLYHAIRGGHGHGHRQRRPARRLRGHRARACASASRTWCSTAAPTRPSACSRSPSSVKGRSGEDADEDLAWRELPVRRAARARARARHRRVRRRGHRGGAAARRRARST